MPQVVLYGNDQAVRTIGVQLITSTLSLAIAVAAELEETALPALVAVSQLAENTVQKATPKLLGAADVIVVTDFAGQAEATDATAEASAEPVQTTNLNGLRRLINDAMAAGFAGTLIIAMRDDAVMTYFAQRFSGLPKEHVVGLGTAGLTTVFERTIARSLGVPFDSVTAYVVGTVTDYVLVWSRAYVGVTPVLRIAKPVDGQPPQLMQTCLDACARFAEAPSASWPLLIERLLMALAGDPLLVPLTVVVSEDEQTTSYSRPVLVSPTGAEAVATVSGTEAEEAELATISTQVSETITQIESGETNDEDQ